MTGDCFDPELDPELDGGLVCEDHLDERLIDIYFRGVKAAAVTFCIPAAVAVAVSCVRTIRRCTRSRP